MVSKVHELVDKVRLVEITSQGTELLISTQT